MVLHLEKNITQPLNKAEQIWSQLPPISSSGLNSWSPHTLTWYRTPSGPTGALKGPVLAQNSPFGALGGHRETKFGSNCPHLSAWVGFMFITHFDLISGHFWHPLPSEYLRGHQKGFWGQNEPFWGPQEYRRGP